MNSVAEKKVKKTKRERFEAGDLFLHNGIRFYYRKEKHIEEVRNDRDEFAGEVQVIANVGFFIAMELMGKKIGRLVRFKECRFERE